MLHHHLKLLSKMYLNPLLERVEEEMDNIFTNVLQTKISEGCLQGKLCANDVVAKWSAPVCNICIFFSERIFYNAQLWENQICFQGCKMML